MLRKINYLQIIVHFTAFYFFIFSLQTFSYLFNITQIEKIERYGFENVLKNHDQYGIDIEDIAYFSFWPSIACLLGIICAFIISIVISKIKNWSFLNSFIVLIISYFLYRFDFLGWDYLRPFLSLGQFASSYRLNFIITGTFLMIISLIIFFSKWTNRIIQNQYNNRMSKTFQ